MDAAHSIQGPLAEFSVPMPRAFLPCILASVDDSRGIFLSQLLEMVHRTMPLLPFSKLLNINDHLQPPVIFNFWSKLCGKCLSNNKGVVGWQ